MPWGSRRVRSAGRSLAIALDLEFGPSWADDLPQRLLEAIWDGDARALASDARRLGRVLATSDEPTDNLLVQVEFLQALYGSAMRWVDVSHRDDPHGDELRYGEVPVLLRERLELQQRAAATVTLKGGDPLAGRWLAAAADLVVRSIRFRDGFALPALVQGLGGAPRRGRHLVPVDEPLTIERYLAQLAEAGGRIVNGTPEGARNAADCMRLIKQRFGGEYPFATAVRVAVKAIHDGDEDTLRELADMTAAAVTEDSPARVLHNLVLAGSKVLHDAA